jgi:hypothetical protein
MNWMNALRKILDTENEGKPDVERPSAIQELLYLTENIILIDRVAIIS